MAGVALDPVPLDAVRAVQGVELLPEVDVLHRLLVGGAPALALPGADPLRDALLHVLRVRVDAHAARPPERLERADHRGELHAVVGGGALAAEHFPLRAVQPDDGAPAARPRIAAAGAVAEYVHGVLSQGCGVAAG